MEKTWGLFTAVVYEGYDLRGVFDSELAAVDAAHALIEKMGDELMFDWCYIIELQKNKLLDKSVSSMDARFIYDKSEEK